MAGNMQLSIRARAAIGTEAWPRDDWDDNSNRGGDTRRFYRRAAKRRERQRVAREIRRELAE